MCRLKSILVCGCWAQVCVKRRAELSVAMNPSCSSQWKARAAVDRVFDRCFADTAPFDRCALAALGCARGGWGVKGGGAVDAVVVLMWWEKARVSGIILRGLDTGRLCAAY